MEGERITTCMLDVETCNTTIRRKINIIIKFCRLDDGAYRVEYDVFGQEILRYFLPDVTYISQILRKVYGLRIAAFSDVVALRECIREISEYERENESMLAKAKRVIKGYIESAMCGIFDTRNCAGDYMETICDEGNLTIDICYEYEYFEVFGLSMAEFQQLEEFYETLRKEVRAKEKETTEMNDYTVMAEHGVSCIIKHQKQEETEICVKIISHADSGRYEVIYRNWSNEPWKSYTKFYVGIPCLGEVRDDIWHFYGAGCINVNDIRVLLDEACCVSRHDNMAKQLLNSRYGLAAADIRECFGDSAYNKIYNNLDISREMQFAYTGKWPGIECKTTAKSQYRNRGKLPEISEVIFNKPATIVKWADGTKTVVKVQGKERYNKEKGLAMAIAKKAMGNSNYYYTIMERYLEDEK